MTDNTIMHPKCEHLQHLVDLFLFKGAPVNEDPDRQVQILVNQGFVVGFCPQRNQPLWAAYRVAGADQDVDFDRPHLYYADKRLDEAHRLSSDTFGRHNGVGYHVGHMVPNEVINRQYGRLAQTETFFMSNMSPQNGRLNGGLWLKLEDKIRKIENTRDKDHMWAIAGPIFGENPDIITRDGGIEVPIPEAYYYVTADPFRYPWDRESNVDQVNFILSQDDPSSKPLEDCVVDLAEVEQRTRLKFFPGWDHSIAFALGNDDPRNPAQRHRLLRQLR